MPDVVIRLEIESQRTNALLQRLDNPYFPLAVAAAIAFHQAHSSALTCVSQRDYDGALDIAAAALSRLIPVYTLREPQGRRVTVVVDLTRARFARGAAQLGGAQRPRFRAVAGQAHRPALELRQLRASA